MVTDEPQFKQESVTVRGSKTRPPEMRILQGEEIHLSVMSEG